MKKTALYNVFVIIAGKKNATYVALREGYKTLIFRGGSLHLKSWYYITDF